MRLPAGDYLVTSWRVPEYLRQQQKVRISDTSRLIAVRLQRWIDPARGGGMPMTRIFMRGMRPLYASH